VPEIKYAFIQRHKLVWPISVQCRVLLVHISAVYAENRGAYGWPRIWRQLRSQGIHVGKQRVQLLMKKHGIQERCT
jgi:transposase InsO family protein